MHTEQDFLKQICSQPDDDNVRLVYADWLQEHDRAEQAEFVRVQVELHQLKYVGNHIAKGRSGELKQIEADFFNRRRKWRPEKHAYPPSLGHWNWEVGVTYERGLVKSVEIGMVALIEGAITLFQHYPITEVLLEYSPSVMDSGKARIEKAPGYYGKGVEWELFDIMRKYGRHRRSWDREFVEFLDLDSAIKARSWGCVDFGRQQAGLPPLRRARLV